MRHRLTPSQRVAIVLLTLTQWGAIVLLILLAAGSLCGMANRAAL